MCITWLELQDFWRKLAFTWPLLFGHRPVSNNLFLKKSLLFVLAEIQKVLLSFYSEISFIRQVSGPQLAPVVHGPQPAQEQL